MNNTNLTLSQLRDAAQSLRETISDLDAEIKSIEAELLHRFASEGAALLKKRDQEHGEATFEVDGIKLKYAASKTVGWDSEKLSAIAANMTDEERTKLFKVKITVPEKEWQAASPSLAQDLTPARTVKYSEPKITFA
jgi:hypothetical protein